MTARTATRRLCQVAAAAGTACLAGPLFVTDDQPLAPPTQASSGALPAAEVFSRHLQHGSWTPDTVLQLGAHLSALLRTAADISSQPLSAALSSRYSMQLRLPSVASLPLPAPLARPLQPATAAALSGSARPSWQPSYSAMPEHAGRHMRQPMSGGRLAAAQRQASMRGTSTSVRAQKLAAEHADVIASLRATMKARGVQLPKSHFADPDVELARYAVTVGLLTANTPEEKRAVVEAAAVRAQQTVEWLESHSFMPEEQLGQWTHVVHWAEDDADGHPVLVVHLAAALQQDDAGAIAAAEAILAHMEYALAHRLGDGPGRPEQLTVVLDSHGAPTLQFRKLVRTIQNIALTLNRHYPARLHRLFLVDAPAIVHLPVRALRTMLHPSTSQKIVICDSADPRLPATIAAAAPAA